MGCIKNQQKEKDWPMGPKNKQKKNKKKKRGRGIAKDQ